MNADQPLIDQLYREEIARARKMTRQERMRATFEASEFALAMMRSSLRNRHPEASDAQIIRLGKERLEKVRRIDEVRLYRR